MGDHSLELSPFEERAKASTQANLPRPKTGDYMETRNVQGCSREKALGDSRCLHMKAHTWTSLQYNGAVLAGSRQHFGREEVASCCRPANNHEQREAQFSTSGEAHARNSQPSPLALHTAGSLAMPVGHESGNVEKTYHHLGGSKPMVGTPPILVYFSGWTGMFTGG